MIVGKMISIVENARYVYNKEAVDYISVICKNGYVQVESRGIDSDFCDSWDLVKIAPREVEQAIKIIHMINFGDDIVHYLDDGVEVYPKRSPRIIAIEESIDALRRANFYKELHQEESCVYSCIVKKNRGAVKELKQFLTKYPNVECHYDYGIHKLYM